MNNQTSSNPLFGPWYQNILIAIAFVLLVIALIWHLSVLQKRIIEESSLHNAKIFAESLATMRTVYSTEVVAAARRHGLEISHDYKKKENAIPLPATMAMILGQRIGERVVGAQSHLYSPYPFPWRAGRPEQNDEFLKDAWIALSRNSDQEYFRFENQIEGKVLRYAIADIMTKGCISCHNSHPDSPKQNWQEGQIRGVLAITLPIESITATTSNSLRSTGSFYGLIGLLGLLTAIYLSTRNRNTAKQLEQQVEERTHSLSDAKLEAEKANIIKTDFINKISHEIRTPLHGIRGFAQIGSQKIGLLPENRIAEYFKKIDKSSNRLQNLIDELLDLSKMEAGKLDLNLSYGNLLIIVKDCLEELEALIQEKYLDIVFDIDVSLGLDCDEVQIRRVILNLLNNAIKHSPVNGKIQINGSIATLQDDIGVYIDSVKLGIIDDGKGIPQQELSTIFDKFSQSNTNAQNDGTTGLGLAICKEIVNLHQGKIWAENHTDGGTAFYIALPISPPEDNNK